MTPFPQHGLLAEDVGDGGKDARFRHAGPFAMQILEALEIDPAAEFHQPVDGLIHQAGVVAAEAGGEQQQGLGVGDPIVASARVSRDADGGPLVPEEIDHPLSEAATGIGE